jgi:glucose/arabinose dehydrogenase
MIALGDGRLAVMNAKSTASRVLLWDAPEAGSGIRPFAGSWVQKDDTNPGMVHPYQIVVGPDGNLYAGNQDTNTITRYAGLGSADRGKPLPVPVGLANFGTLFPGTVVPNDQQSPEGIGLVRGFTFGPDGLLYVCDRGRERVAAYDPATGRFVRTVLDATHGAKHPIQALFTPDGRHLLVSDNKANCVFAVSMSSGRAFELVRRGEGGLDAASSLAIMGKDLYVGSRLGKKILRYELKDGRFLGVFAELPSNPEFMIPVSQQ